MARDVGFPEPLQIVEALGEPGGAGDVHDLGWRVVAVQAVQVALLLAGERGRGRGGGLRRRRHRGLQPRREGAAARPGARLTIQQPAARRNVNTIQHTLNKSKKPH